MTDIDLEYKKNGCILLTGTDQYLLEQQAITLIRTLLKIKNNENLYSHPDLFVIESEASGGIKIKQIKDILIENNKTSVSGGKKVFFIKNGHLLRNESANALLKTLEEPNINTYFVILASNQDMILPTILSRSFVINITHEIKNCDNDIFNFYQGNLKDIIIFCANKIQMAPQEKIRNNAEFIEIALSLKECNELDYIINKTQMIYYVKMLMKSKDFLSFFELEGLLQKIDKDTLKMIFKMFLWESKNYNNYESLITLINGIDQNINVSIITMLFFQKINDWGDVK